MVENPEQELRFTRARQARVFFVFSALLYSGSSAGLIGALLPYPYGAPELLQYWYLLIPLLLVATLSLRVGIHCAKHAYLILTPLGIEIFPLIKPSKNLNLIYWSEINSIEIQQQVLLIHRNAEKTSGTVISLKPIHTKQLPLLNKAISSRK